MAERELGVFNITNTAADRLRIWQARSCKPPDRGADYVAEEQRSVHLSSGRNPRRPRACVGAAARRIAGVNECVASHGHHDENNRYTPDVMRRRS